MAYSKKGISNSIGLFLGLVACVFLIIVTFKLLGVYSNYQNEQQAQITAKNLQTAMNSVCLTGQPVEVNVNFPQEVSSGGTSILGTIAGALTGEKISVTNAIRYTTALKSYGDPWYVLYYQYFPDGEDSSWTGWNEIAGMRVATTSLRGAEAASCLATGLIPFLGDMKRIGVVGAKKAGAKISSYIDELVDVMRGSKTLSKSEATIDVLSAANKLDNVKPGVLEELFSNTYFRKMITNSKKAGRAITAPLQKILNFFSSYSDDMVKGVRSVTKTDSAAKSYIKANTVLKSTDDLDSEVAKLLGDITHRDYSDTLRKIANNENGLVTDSMKTSVSKLRQELDLDYFRTSIYSPLNEKQLNHIDDILTRLEKNEPVYGSEISAIKKYLAGAGIDATDFNDALDSIYLKKTSVDQIADTYNKYVVGSNPTSLFRSQESIVYTRGFAYDLVDDVPTSIPSIAKRLGFKESFIRNIKNRPISQAASYVTHWGTWYGLSWIASTALSVADLAEMKFYPCSGNALCLKSQVNPSITVYPLDDCAEQGIEWIELNKHAKDGAVSGTTVTNAMDSLASAFMGNKPYTQFYTASPCKGRIEITKGVCNCAQKKVPYIDDSTLVEYYFNCTVKDTALNLAECNFSQRMLDEENEYEPEQIKMLSKKIVVAQRSIEDPLEESKELNYILSIDINQEIWKIYGVDEITLNERLALEDLSEYENEKIECIDSVLEYETEVKFGCTIQMPAIAFNYTTCEGSNFWLRCTNWTKISDGTGTRDALEGEEELSTSTWNCFNWSLDYYSGGINSGANSIQVIRVKDIKEYREVDKINEIGKNYFNALMEFNKTIGTPNNVRQYYIDSFYPSPETVGETFDLVWKNINPASVIKDMFNEEYVLKNFPLVQTIADLSEVTLPSEYLLNDSNVNQLFMYNLRAEDKIPCLKVTYIADETSGFCYSSPTAAAQAEEVVWAGVSTAADLIIEAALRTTVVGNLGAGLISCEVGNAIMWFGQDRISDAKEKQLWPNNIYFKNYYTER